MSQGTAAGPTPSADSDDAEFFRLYGPWQPFTPAEAQGLFDPIGVDWWIAGGYAIEAFTGVARTHEDIDVSIFRRDLPTLRAALSGRFHMWSAGSGMLRPLNDTFPEPHAESDQVWLREHSLAPWRADVVLNPDIDGMWQSRRDPDFAAPLDEVTWARDGIRYLRPAVSLSFKARLARPKDHADFEAALAMLGDEERAWLADFLSRKEPEHPWRERLQAPLMP